MQYDLNKPWETLDEWQKEYINTPPEQNCLLLTGRQCGKTTAMSIKAVELLANNFKEGENILISSLTEKQAYRILAKSLVYATLKYPEQVILKGKHKPTMHKLLFGKKVKKGRKIEYKEIRGLFCYAAGEKGEGLRGDTIKKQMVDEGSRMSEEFFVSVIPMLSVSNGSIDIASTPHGTKDKDGRETYFYKCSKDDDFKKFFIDAENCSRHSKEFLEKEKKRLTKLQYAQEYLAQFTDSLQRLFSDELIENICVLERRKKISDGKYYLGSDIAGLGNDETTIEIIEKKDDGNLEHVENEILLKKLTTQTSKKIKWYDKLYNFKKIGIDDAGVGFGVFSELMTDFKTKKKTEALNNASRLTDNEKNKSKKLLKEEMYVNLLILMENNKIKLLKDDEVKASLSSIQFENTNQFKIFGNYSHITEGIIRASWLATQDKSLNMFVHSF